MRIRNKHIIKCDREQVWELLMDINFLGKVIPGGRRFSKSGRNEYTGNLRVKAGPIGAQLNARLTRERMRMPRSFRLRVNAKGKGIKISGKVDFRLKRLRECETELSYTGNFDFRGIPGFVIGEIHRKLKKAIKDLCKRIEKACECHDKPLPIEGTEESVREVSKLESQFEQEIAEIIRKAQSQFEVELAELITRAGSQLKADLTELFSRVENQRQEENRDAH